MSVKRYGSSIVHINGEKFPVLHSIDFDASTGKYVDKCRVVPAPEKWKKHVEFIRTKGAFALQKTIEGPEMMADGSRALLKSAGIIGVFDVTNFSFDDEVLRLDAVKRTFMRY
jgi:hypothetical protein